MNSAGLIGRDREARQLAELVDGFRAGQSRTLVLRGEAGIGKTALLDEVALLANGCTTLRAAGVQAEMELAFAGLHQLLTPILGQLGRVSHMAGPGDACAEDDCGAVNDGEFVIAGG
ncbi:AAA family ATPase [Mycobacterium interjectum]|uniref:AAA family ATPase n=1 Tax=Mycobacterium interjectum TaxID=33895 RepID=UPI001F3B2573|nr:ATP-binding protein [Mycobacterium interjectum]